MKKTLLSMILLASVATTPLVLAQGSPIEATSPVAFIGSASVNGTVNYIDSDDYNFSGSNIEGAAWGTMQRINISGTVLLSNPLNGSETPTKTIEASSSISTRVNNATFIQEAVGNSTTGWSLGIFTYEDNIANPYVVAFKNPTKTAPGEIVEVEDLSIGLVGNMVKSSRVVTRFDSNGDEISYKANSSQYVALAWNMDGFSGLSLANLALTESETATSSSVFASWKAKLESIAIIQ
jgi:hypothetical protein